MRSLQERLEAFQSSSCSTPDGPFQDLGGHFKVRPWRRTPRWATRARSEGTGTPASDSGSGQAPPPPTSTFKSHKFCRDNSCWVFSSFKPWLGHPWGDRPSPGKKRHTLMCQAPVLWDFFFLSPYKVPARSHAHHFNSETEHGGWTMWVESPSLTRNQGRGEGPTVCGSHPSRTISSVLSRDPGRATWMWILQWFPSVHWL